MTTLKIDANRPTAQRVVDGGDSWHVQLDLTPVAAGLLLDLGRALFDSKQTWRLRAIGTPGLIDAEKAKHVQAVLAELLTARRHPLILELGPDQAEELQADLLEATVEPPWCRSCAEAYAARTDGHCPGCGNTADLADAGISQLRAV